MSRRGETRLTSQPPNGAAITPPMISATRLGSGDAPSSTKNVVAAAMVTKNSVVLTEPTARRGACPDPTSAEVATGPHPPPPLASRNPAAKPTGGTQPAGASRVGNWRIALDRMKRPIADRYTAT